MTVVQKQKLESAPLKLGPSSRKIYALWILESPHPSKAQIAGLDSPCSSGIFSAYAIGPRSFICIFGHRILGVALSSWVVRCLQYYCITFNCIIESLEFVFIVTVGICDIPRRVRMGFSEGSDGF